MYEEMKLMCDCCLTKTLHCSSHVNNQSWILKFTNFFTKFSLLVFKVHIMQLDHIRFAKSPFYFWPITCFSVFPAQFWIFSKLLKHSKHCQVLAMFGMFETLRQLIDQKPSQWIKFQDWEPDKQRLEFKTVAGNKEHKFIGQKLGEDFAKFLWPSQNIWTLWSNSDIRVP